MAKERFDHAAIEQEAQARWQERALYETDLTDESKDPYYLLFEFPYPSGDLHIGHWYAFALTDIFARMKRTQGKNVLFPMGFDAFGLPAENAAMKYGKDPAAWTEANMETMRAQVRSMGTSVDWSKEVVTCSPEYYKWTQWLFTKLYEQGLAYRKEAAVKWCPKDQTVLANEQVADGKCERCGTEVEEKSLTQWFMGITKYAERLLADLEPLPWREEMKEAQRAWIGKSEGAKIAFRILFGDKEKDAWRDADGSPAQVAIFTTRPDTLFGATYLVLAPEHPWVAGALAFGDEVFRNEAEIRAYIDATAKKTERERQEHKEKTGVQLEGIMAVNPATGEQIPVYIADYVLASYGTGAVMAVPAHDERDFAFAKIMGLPLRTVIEGEAPGADAAYTGDGVLKNSGIFDGKQNREALWDIVESVGGERVTNYRLRDWLVSRQRYWGCPIPIVYDPDGNPQPIPAEHLPWLLPTDVDFTPSGKSPLATSQELQERVTRLFGEGWTPEYDTLDTFVDSSWYFLRYLDPKDEHDFSDQALMKRWLPVNRYSGGSEHTTMHLLYARFFHKALYDLALVPTPEPFVERYNRGLILGPDGQKMSKSKGNVINPDAVVAEHGADAVRMYLAFIGPYNEPGSYPWKLDGVAAMRKFLDRIYALREKVADGELDASVQQALSRAVAKVTEDTERFKYNTAISALMVLVRDLEALPRVPRAAYETLLIILAPYAPHLAEHLYAQEESIHTASWPEAAMAIEETVTLVVQVNGKKKGELTVRKEMEEEEALSAAKELPAVARALEEGEVRKVVYVPGRILNLVVG
ncbi:MAG TPA: leucine--tRNA ligase [Candidatus Paceibacterota bacterium]